MANYFPIALVNGSIYNMDSTKVVNPAFFSVTRSIAPTSNSFATNLPDPYLFQTQSTEVSVSTNGVSSSVMSFTFPARQETQYYISEVLLRASSATFNRTGPRISIDRTNLSDGFFRIQAATGISTVIYLNQGTKDSRATASMTDTAASNYDVPIISKGLFFNSTNNINVNNTIYIETSASVNVTSKTGSIFYNHFVGFSSSLTPFTSNMAPIALISGTFDSITTGDLITQSVLPPTASYWFSSSLNTQVTNTNTSSWTTIFTISGLTDNKTYLVNYFLKCQSAATTTGVHLRVASGSNYNGMLYSVSSGNNTAPSTVSNNPSLGTSQIQNTIPTGMPSANSDRLFWGEYSVTKATGLNPTIELRSEVSGSRVLANSGSVVFWRLIE